MTLIIKDNQGKVAEKITKPNGLLKEKDIPGIMLRLLKSNECDEIRTEVIESFIDTTEKMLEYFQMHNSMEIIGSSILLMVDNVTRRCSMKIIDLSSCREYDEETQRDHGYIKGL